MTTLPVNLDWKGISGELERLYPLKTGRKLERSQVRLTQDQI